MSVQVDKFMKVRGQSIQPGNKVRILYGIVFSLSREELVELRRQVGARLARLKELDAPAVIIFNQEVLDKKVYALIGKAEARLEEAVL